MASNFPTAYVRVTSQTYVLQHIFLANQNTDTDTVYPQSTLLLFRSVIKTGPVQTALLPERAARRQGRHQLLGRTGRDNTPWD